MLLVVFAGVALWAHFERQKQDESFAVALSTLHGEPGITPVGQRQAALSKTDRVYHWRAIVWRRVNGSEVPLIWSAKVRGEAPMRVVESSLIPYDEGTAWKLELFEDVETAKVE